MSQRVWFGWLCALLATIAYSTNTPISRGAILAGMNPGALLAARFGLAMLLFAGTLTLTPVGKVRGAQKPLDRRGIWLGILAGAVNGLTLAAFYWGLTRLSASVATILTIALIPAFTLVLLAWRGEPLTARKLLRLALSLAGVYCLVGFGGTIDGLGLALTVAGAFFFAIHLVMMQLYLKVYNTWRITGLVVTSAGVVVVLLWLIGGGDTYVPGWPGWLAIIVQGILATYVARLLTYAAINVIGSAQFALLSPLEMVLTVWWSILFLGEWITARQWFGAGLVLISVLLAVQFRPKAPGSFQLRYRLKKP